MRIYMCVLVALKPPHVFVSATNDECERLFRKKNDQNCTQSGRTELYFTFMSVLTSKRITYANNILLPAGGAYTVGKYRACEIFAHVISLNSPEMYA